MSSVLEKDEAEKLAVPYTPRKFPQAVSPAAKEFVSRRTPQAEASFRIDPLNALQAGVAELDRISVEQRVERLAMEKVQRIRDEAYQEAFQSGLDEGRERAFSESREVLDGKLAHLGELLAGIAALKADLVTANEAHLMKLLFFMARRVAMDEVRARPEVILPVLRQAVESAQSEEKIVAKVSRSDFEFIQAAAGKLGKGLEFVARVELEESDAIRPGGCVVETNYGSVDASIERRVERLWETISEKLPKAGDTFGDG